MGTEATMFPGVQGDRLLPSCSVSFGQIRCMIAITSQIVLYKQRYNLCYCIVYPQLDHTVADVLSDLCTALL